jgi:hypothetical protein
MNKAIQLFLLMSIIFITSCNKNQKSVKSDEKESKKINVNKNINEIETNKKLESCVDIVIEILTTSPVYLDKTKGLYEAVVKNGGISFGITIEGSPNPEKDGSIDFSESYDFSLHETYTDRMPIIARFTFNPTEKKLYEHDFSEDKFKAIDFDKNLLLKFNEICK